MENTIIFEKGEYGQRAIIIGEWKTIYLETFIAKNIIELELNDGKGWKGKNIDFLIDLPFIQSLTIIDFTINSIEPINYLFELKTLELITYSKTPVNFENFTKLENCNFEWIKGSDTLFKLKTLKKLFIN